MKNFEKNYKSTFDKINISFEELEDIQQVFYKNKNNFKIRYAIFCIVVLCFTFTTVVFGKEIIENIKGFIWEKGIVELPNSNGITVDGNYTKLTDTVEIKNESPFNEEEKGKKFSISDLEERLGIRILRNSFSGIKNDYILEYIKFNNGKSSYISFITPQEDWCNNSNYWYIELSFGLRTQYATEGEKNQAFSIGAPDSTYHIKSLDVIADIHIVTEATRKNSPTIARASFIHNGITYNVRIMKRNYKAEDLYNVLEGFTLD